MLLFGKILVTGLTLITVAWAQNASVISLENCCSTTLEATAFALVYALPLIQLVNQSTAVFKAVGGVNKINSQDQLASLTSAAVVKPNVDTLYSRVIVDLSQSDLELTVPNITDRFWTFPFYDTFGNNFANISPVNGSKAGLYLIRRADDALVEPGLKLTDPKKYPKYQGIVNFPTTFGTSLIRLLLKYNTTDNLNIVHAIQNATKLVPVPRVVQQPRTLVAPQFVPTVNSSFTGTPPEQLLQLLAKLAANNQPEVLSERYRVASILGLAGVAAGQYNRPSGVNVTQAYAIANNTIQKYISDPATFRTINGWQVPNSPYAGNFGVHYAHRAYVARTGYQQNVLSITVYPGYQGPAFGPYTLAPNKAFLYTFSGKPPVRTDLFGFWSLTYYGADQYLIPNPLNRFSLGDRSNLTYVDGTPVYGSGSKNSTNGPFKILIQQADLAPPQNWTNNWIPSPAGGGNGSYILRWYSPSDAFFNGAYVYPKVELIDAIR